MTDRDALLRIRDLIDHGDLEGQRLVEAIRAIVEIAVAQTAAENP